MPNPSEVSPAMTAACKYCGKTIGKGLGIFKNKWYHVNDGDSSYCPNKKVFPLPSRLPASPVADAQTHHVDCPCAYIVREYETDPCPVNGCPQCACRKLEEDELKTAQVDAKFEQGYTNCAEVAAPVAEGESQMDNANQEGDGVFIGTLRRELFMPYDCKWNGYIREVTAELEKDEKVSRSAAYARIFSDCAKLMSANEFSRNMRSEL